jgi:diacylglycerol kinase (ATP)
MAGLAIIANPHAHRNRVWPLAAQALRKAAPGAPLLETRTPAELREAAREVIGAAPAVVAIAGGDGTVQHTLTALADAADAAGPRSSLPQLALLGGGAFDSLASLGGRGDAEVRLKRLAEALRTGAPLRSAERDTLRVGPWLGFRFGAGLPLRFVEAFYERGRLGRLGSLRLVARSVWSSLVGGRLAQRLYRPMPMDVEVDGEAWPPLPFYGLVCSTVAEAGLGLKPFRRATEQPGFFHALGLTAGPRAFARELPRLLAGLPARHDRLLEAVAERIELRCREPFRWFLDGELGDAADGDLRISLGPRVTLVHA